MDGSSRGTREVTSPILYLSKATTIYSCPKRYWWTYYRKIVPKTKNEKMVWGADFHSLCEILGKYNVGVAQAELQTKGFSEEKESEISYGLYLIQKKLEEQGLEEFYAIEEAKSFMLGGPYFTDWFVKPDGVAMFKGKLWNVEYKTTSGWGSSTAAFYHRSIQTASYFKKTKELFPDVVGTKLFVLVRTKEPRVEVEDIQITKDQISKVNNFILITHSKAEVMESTRIFDRYYTQCLELRYGECPYNVICHATSREYQNQWIAEMFEEVNLDAHLGLSGEDT